MNQKMKNPIHVCKAIPSTVAPPNKLFQPPHIAPNRTSSAVPPIHV
jgi:hypothetical protein